MKLSIIVAIAADGVIGRDGNQPFFISEDLKRFKSLTMGHPIIMGRKTFEALPKGALPGRRNIVISRNRAYMAKGAETACSLDEAISMVADSDEAFVIGGGSIYGQAMQKADKLYVTFIHATVPDADTFFPPILETDWELASQSDRTTDPKTGLTYRFREYSRR